MGASDDPHPVAIEEASLASVVQRALGRDRAQVTSWRCETLQGGGGGGGVYRVAGTARDGCEDVHWSVVHKVVRSADGATDPASLRYWAREPLAYRTGALAALPGGLATPRCYAVDASRDGEYGLWLEDVVDAEAWWSLERFRMAARLLGRFNAAYVAGAPLPSWPWLSRGLLRSWIGSTGVAANMERARAAPEGRFVRRWYPDDLLERVLRLWDEHDGLLDALDRLPRTLCHMDAFRRNLLVRRGRDGRERVVLIDWAFVGTGALGEELAPLVAASVGFFGADVADLEALDRMAFDGYLAGLADAGWSGDPRDVRFAYAAASGLRLALPAMLDLQGPGMDALHERVLGRPMAEILATWVPLKRFLLGLADEARELSPGVG